MELTQPVKLIKRCMECDIQDAIINWDTSRFSKVRLILNFGSFKVYFRIRGIAVQAKKRVFLELYTSEKKYAIW